MKRMKCKTEDYSDAHLPETRKAVFMQRYKEHFSLILYLGFFVLLFMLPMLLITLARDVYIITAAAALEEQIREQPELWLWSHKRWKRTYEEWLRVSENWARTKKNSIKDNK